MIREKCDECGGKLNKKSVEYVLYGVSLGFFPAEVCNRCGETCFDETVSKEMTTRAKEKGLWGLAARVKIGKVGDALDIRLNKKMVEFLGVKKGVEVLVMPVSRHKIEVSI